MNALHRIGFCITTISVVFLLPAFAFAQDDTSEQLWTDYHAHYYRSDRWEYYGDGGVRFGGGAEPFFRAYMRPSMRDHRTERLRLHYGLGVFYTDNKNSVNTLEIRPWEGLRYKWPTIGRITLGNYFRLEQRVIFNTDTWETSFQLRFRYQLGTTIPLRAQFLRGYFVPISAEVFFDAGDNVDFFADESRFNIGLGYVISKEWVFNFLLTLQQSRSSADDTFTTTDVIFRFQLKQLLAAKDYFGKLEVPDN